MSETNNAPMNTDSIWNDGTKLLSRTFLTYIGMKIAAPSGAPAPQVVREMKKDGWNIDFEQLEQDAADRGADSFPYTGISSASVSSAYAVVSNPQGERVRHSNPEYVAAVIAAENKL